MSLSRRQAATSAGLVGAAALSGLTGGSPRPVTVSAAELVGQVTGADSPNRTDRRFAITATDLGISWDTGRTRVLVTVGDTYGTV